MPPEPASIVMRSPRALPQRVPARESVIRAANGLDQAEQLAKLR
jgi:hypothetical protein